MGGSDGTLIGGEQPDLESEEVSQEEDSLGYEWIYERRDIIVGAWLPNPDGGPSGVTECVLLRE